MTTIEERTHRLRCMGLHRVVPGDGVTRERSETGQVFTRGKRIEKCQHEDDCWPLV